MTFSSLIQTDQFVVSHLAHIELARIDLARIDLARIDTEFQPSPVRSRSGNVGPPGQFGTMPVRSPYLPSLGSKAERNSSGVISGLLSFRTEPSK